MSEQRNLFFPVCIYIKDKEQIYRHLRKGRSSCERVSCFSLLLPNTILSSFLSVWELCCFELGVPLFRIAFIIHFWNSGGSGAELCVIRLDCDSGFGDEVDKH